MTKVSLLPFSRFGKEFTGKAAPDTLRSFEDDTMYTLANFFPLAHRFENGTWERLPARKISDFEPKRPITVTRKNVAAVVSWIVGSGQLWPPGKKVVASQINRKSIHDKLHALIGGMWEQTVCNFLGVANLSEAAYLIDSQAFEQDMFANLTFKQNASTGPACSIKTAEYSNKTSAPIGDDCLTSPSRHILELNSEQQKNVARLLMMGYELKGPLSTLPVCGQPSQQEDDQYLPGESCWGKVLNERGICYSTSMGKQDPEKTLIFHH